MKRFSAFVLALLLALSVFACGNQRSEPIAEPTAELTPEPTEEPTPEPTAVPTVEPTAEPQPPEEPEDYDLWKAVEAELYTEESGEERVKITAAIPDGATLVIKLSGQEDYSYTNTKGELTYRKVRIPVEAFFPGMPLETAEGEIAPHVTITTADGTEYEIECPVIPYTFPTLSFEITSAFEAAEDGSIHVKAGQNGVYRLSGTVSDSGASVQIDGTYLYADAEGVFAYELPAPDGAAATYVLTAEKNNCVTASLTIVVEP